MDEEKYNIKPSRRTPDDDFDELSRILFKDEVIEISPESLEAYRKYEDSFIPNERPTEASRGRTKEKKKKSAGSVIRKIVLVVAAIAFLGSGAVIAKRGVQYLKMKNTESQIEDLTLSDDDLLGFDSTDGDTLKHLIEKYPQLAGVNFPANFNYRYALLYAANPEFVGYLKIDGTSINTAVVQHKNDDNYYYDYDFYGKKSVYGAIFALSHNNMVNLDRNTVLIGHHMKDGSRFHDLVTYKTIDGYKKAPIIEFNTPYNNYKWKVYGAFILNGATSGDNGYLLDTMFNNVSNNCFASYINEINKRTLYTTGVDILPTDKILTLVTCTYEFTNARLIVIARMVRPGEDATVDLSLVQAKSTPIKYPQALYDKRGKTNPYVNDEKWYPY